MKAEREAALFRNEDAQLADLGADGLCLEQSLGEFTTGATVADAHLRKIKDSEKLVWNTRDAGAPSISMLRQAMRGLPLSATLPPELYRCPALRLLRAGEGMQ